MPLFPLRRRPAPAPRNRRAPAALAPAPFHPTPLQSRFFALLADGVPSAEACATLPVNRVTFYRWRQDPAFRYWLASNQLRDLVLDGGALLTMARAKAAENFPYWNALARLTFDPTTRQHLCDWAEWCGAGSAAPSLAAAPAASDPEAENVAFKAVTD